MQIVEEGLPVQVPERPRDAAEHHMVEDPFLEYDAEGVRRAETDGSVFRGGRDAFLLSLGGVASLGQLEGAEKVP